jgi:trehalose 6-phosphate phosphatase
LEYILPALSKVLGRIRSGKRLLLLSDFDGTLVPIVDRPEMAHMPDTTRDLLNTLSRYPWVTVGIISGRALSDLKGKVNLERLIYVGNHGFEIQSPEINFINPIADEMTPIFRMMGRVLSRTLGSFRGVFVEDKGITLSVHFRQAEVGAADEIRQIVQRSVTNPRFAGLFRITSGKKVLELSPAVSWNKGKAVRLLMKRYGKGGRRSGLIPIYLGDDLTDEDAFKVIAQYGMGFSIYVGARPIESAAEYYLKSTSEVQILLSGLTKASRGEALCDQLSIV